MLQRYFQVFISYSRNTIYDFEMRIFSAATGSPILEILRISENLLH